MKKKASLTVEAALVLPVFIYAITMFLYFFQIIYIQEKIQLGLTEVAREASQYAYIHQNILKEQENQLEVSQTGKKEENTQIQAILKGMASGTFFRTKLKEYISVREIDQSCIKDGFEGIKMYASTFMQKQEVDIVAAYKIRFPLLFFNLQDTQVVQRVRTRGFVGTRQIGLFADGKNNDKDEWMVYITPTGSVYHLSSECTHISLSIRAVYYHQVEDLRNENGGKYKSCDKCAKTNILKGNTVVYIAKEGDRYHEREDCSGLKRSVEQVPLSQVGERNKCSRCGY